MNWIDFNILCIGEKIPEIVQQDKFIVEVMNKNPNKLCKCYIDCWHVISSMKGIWYEFWIEEEFLTSNYFIQDKYKVVENENQAAHGYPLKIKKSLLPVFKEIINFYLMKSPIHSIIVLFRHQGYEKERIHNAIDLNNFIYKLKLGKIFGNVAYIVKDN